MLLVCVALINGAGNSLVEVVHHQMVHQLLEHMVFVPVKPRVRLFVWCVWHHSVQTNMGRA